MNSKIVLVSGGFDPLHIGHLRMLRAACDYGCVVVALNSDEWLYRKKGFFMMPFDERREILMALPEVSLVVPVDDTNGTVVDAIERVKPHYFANGGDRKAPNDLEHAACTRLCIAELFNIGGEKVQSSSSLARRIV